MKGNRTLEVLKVGHNKKTKTISWCSSIKRALHKEWELKRIKKTTPADRHRQFIYTIAQFFHKTMLLRDKTISMARADIRFSSNRLYLCKKSEEKKYYTNTSSLRLINDKISLFFIMCMLFHPSFMPAFPNLYCG